MKDQYNDLFEEVHLSETAKEKLWERAEKLTCTERRRGRGRTGFKAAVLVGVMLLGSTGIYAATQLPKLSEKKHDSKWQVQVEKDHAEISLATNKPEKEEKSALYDVKLTYIPEGFKQDKEDTYFYKKGKKDENGSFSVILYHMNTDYKAMRTAKGLEEFQTKEGQGYIVGQRKRYMTMFKYDNVNYIVQIDGDSMSKKEVQKIAEGATLFPVEKKEDIQASYIEWTKELQKENDRYIEKMKKRGF